MSNFQNLPKISSNGNEYTDVKIEDSKYFLIGGCYEEKKEGAINIIYS